MALRMKQVRFSKFDTIVYTHSAVEYDRSPFAYAAQNFYKFRQEITNQQAPATSNMTYSGNKKSSRTPALKIDTTFLNNKGPLFFTNLSTNYGKFDS